MMVGDEVLGVMAVQSYTTSCLYNEHHQQLLNAIANQVAIAIQNARQFEEAQRLAGYEQILRQITASINTSSNLLTALPETTRQLQQILPFDVLTLATYTPGNAEFELYAVGAAGAKEQHFGHQGLRLPIEGTCPGWAITHNDVWIDDDLTGSNRFIEDEQLISEGIKSRLVLPLRLGQDVIGTLNLGGMQPGIFTGQYLPLLWQIANQMASALERNRLFEQTQRRARREQTIREITEKMRAAPDLDRLVAIAAEELGHHLSASYAELELGLEPENGAAPVVT